MRINHVWGILSLLIPFATMLDASDDFALRDGDTVAFVGDSITAARTYGEVIENYALLRFPTRQVKFFNAGWGGDTAEGGAARLERDVFSRNATVVIVAFGINDIGWGLRADDLHQQKYLDGIRSIVSQCNERNVRVYICSAAITASDPSTSESGVLQTMCDRGMALARELGGHSIDVQRSMREIQRRVVAENERAQKGENPKTDRKKSENTVTMHAADGVHLNELGQYAMAFAILKGLGAPAEVSTATLDFSTANTVSATGCEIHQLRKDSNDGLEFSRLDQGLPLNFGLFGALNFRFIPFHTEMNRYMLVVQNLPDANYELVVDDRPIGKYSHRQLASGVNISSATANAWQPGGPWDAQCTSLRSLTEARSRLASSELMWNVHLKGSEARPEIGAATKQIDLQIQALQRNIARPMVYRYRLKKVG